MRENYGRHLSCWGFRGLGFDFMSKAAAGTWSPVVITVPTGQTLQINLTNNLSFNNGNKLPTSLVVVEFMKRLFIV